MLKKIVFSMTLIVVLALSACGPAATSTAQLPSGGVTTQPPVATETPPAAPDVTLPPTATGTIAPPPSSENPLRIYFVDVGQGDAILIQTPDGQTALIDGGETDSGIVQYLQSIGIQRVDLIIATHPHADHIGGLVQVMKTFPVTKVVTNGQPHTTTVYEHFLDAIAAAQAEYIEVKRGDALPLGSLNFLVFNPVGNTNPDLNENSIVLQFAYGQTTFLMMGDSGADAESSLLASGLPLKANILKVGHHGSRYSSTPAFLDAVKPEIAVYFAGIDNSYGHPAPQTIAALVSVGAMVYGTDQSGTIIITADLNGYTINTAKNVAGATPALTPSRAPTSVGLEILSVTSPVPAGANATLTAETSPNASCTITVYYKSGASSAAGLGPKIADANGAVSWTWKVGARTTPGTWKIVVSCDSVTQETTFTVQR